MANLGILNKEYRSKLGKIFNGRIAHSSLARKLLNLIFRLYLGIAFLTTLVQIGFHYKNELDNLQEEIHTTVQLALPTLAETLWALDNDGVKTIMQSLSQNSAIVGTRLEADISMTIGQSAIQSPNNISKNELEKSKTSYQRNTFDWIYEQSFTIQHKAHKNKTLGTLRVYSSSHVVWVRTRNVFFALIVNAVVKSAVLWVILYLIIVFFVVLPVKRLTKGLTRIHQELFDQKLIAKSPSTVSTGGDELEFLFRSFILMRLALKKSHRELLIHQQTLEKKVIERTEQLQYQATHDSLTGLLNRVTFNERLNIAIQLEQRYQRGFAVLFIDLDRFKIINDTFGHEAGDILLQEMSKRFAACLRTSDVVARLGGDEFVVLLPEVYERPCPTQNAPH